MTQPRFNQVLRFVSPMFHMPRLVTLFPANNVTSQIAAQSWAASTATAPFRYRTTGLMEPQLTGDLITVQRILSGVSPIDAAMNALAKSSSGDIG